MVSSVVVHETLINTDLEPVFLIDKYVILENEYSYPVIDDIGSGSSKSTMFFEKDIDSMVFSLAKYAMIIDDARKTTPSTAYT
jgi:hypothetical protein